MGKKQSAFQANRIEEPANKLQKEGKTADLEAELLKFDPDSLEGLEKETWYHYYGIVSFQAGNRAEAFKRFQEGLRICPDSANICFSLGQEYEYLGDIESMFSCFDRAASPRVSGTYALAEARYAYLWNRNKKGLTYLSPLVDVYLKLKILDPTFLYIRGMPFFDQTWSFLAAFHFLLGDLTEMKTITDRAESACTDLDFERLHLQLNAIETGNYSDWVSRLEKDIQAALDKKWPTGYLTLQLRVLKARSTEDPALAERTLDSVKLAGNDFP